MDKTLKQKFRQPFGFYMENLIGKHFDLNGIFTMYHAHSHAYEWGLGISDEDMNQLRFLLRVLEINTDKLIERVLDILKGNVYHSDEGYTDSIKRSFSIKDEGELLEKKITLLAVSNLVSSNHIELLRIQDHRLIVSEVKSQYGPMVDHKIEINSSQLKLLLKSAKNNIGASLIYAIALPEPIFIEIPIEELYDKFDEYDNFDGFEFTDYDWPPLGMRIPKKFRAVDGFTMIDKSLYNYSDEPTLYNSILDSFPGKFPRLEEYRKTEF